MAPYEGDINMYSVMENVERIEFYHNLFDIETIF
jgi:hypothetical protein